MVGIDRRSQGIGYLCSLILIGSILSAKASDAATYYVAKTGSDNNSCSQARSQSTPKLTINSGLSCLKAGDTLYVKSGTYEEEFVNPPGGTAGNRVTIAAIPGDTVTLRPKSGANRVFTFASSSSSYITLDGFIMDAVNVKYDAIKITWSGSQSNQSNYIRIQNSEIKNADGKAILDSGRGHEYINLDIHHNGRCLSGRSGCAASHGMYITSSDTLLDRLNVHENSYYGIHVYNSGGGVNNVTVRNSSSWGNGFGPDGGAGIIVSSGSGHKVYNNIVRNNALGIQVWGNSQQIYNNTIFNNKGGCISNTSSGSVIKNNICYQNGSGISGSGATFAGNLCDSAGMGCAVVGNPQFVSVSSGNFNLQAGSPAVDKGVTVSEVSEDYAGVSRPKGSAYDIGAYEYAAGQLSVSLPAPTGLVISSD